MKNYFITIPSYLLWVSFSLAQTPQEFDIYEPELLKSEDGEDLCFLPVEAIVGADVYVIVETYGYIQSLAAARRPKITTLSVSNTGRPIVIIFKALGSEYGGILNFNIESDTDIAGIHFISDIVPRVNGLPANILVTARYTTDRSQGTPNQCVFPPVEEPSLAGFGSENLRSSEYAFRALSALLGRRGFEADLNAYAGINVVSYQLTKGGWEDGVAAISMDTVREFNAIEAEGQMLLDQATPPELPFLPDGAPSLIVPEELGAGDIWPWVISQGYAMVTPPELIRYQCDVDRLWGWSMGIPPQSGASCRWGAMGEPTGGRADGFLLLGPITMTKETCGIAGRPRLLWAGQGATLNVDGHCSIYAVDINRKSWYIDD